MRMRMTVRRIISPIAGFHVVTMALNVFICRSFCIFVSRVGWRSSKR